LAGEEARATQVVQQVIDRWDNSAVGTLAHAWLGGAAQQALAPVPFPSAIQPLVHLRPAPGWEQRAVAAPVRADTKLDAASG
jgi:hypothetical protein